MDYTSEAERSSSNSNKGACDSAHAKNRRLGVHATIPPSKSACSVLILAPPWQSEHQLASCGPFRNSMLHATTHLVLKSFGSIQKKSGRIFFLDARQAQQRAGRRPQPSVG